MVSDQYTPTLSIITPTLNNGKVLGSFLESIRNQHYPQEKVEVLILDGGSTDDTVPIAKRYSAKTYFNEKVLADPGVALGLEKATGDIMMILAVDNIYEDKDAFNTIAKVFQDPMIYAAFPKHVSYTTSSIFTKYINTFTDPFNHFVYGDAANARTFHKVFDTLKHTDAFDVYDFHSSHVRPLIAFAQGFVVRSGYMREAHDSLDDVAPVLSLIQQNKRIAYMYGLSLYHDTVRDLNHFIRKQKWATVNAVNGTSYGIAHRKARLSPWQRFKIKVWPLYGLSIVAPFIRSCYGLYSDREPLWVYHPMMCLISIYSSTISIIQLRAHSSKTINRQ